MNTTTRSRSLSTKTGIAIFAFVTVAVCARQALGLTQDEQEFPQGRDAVAAAPDSHRVLFENALVRVLEVTMPLPGKSEPMHHHRWPGFFLDWDTGGKSPHIRYHRNVHWFETIDEAKAKIEAWRVDYNGSQPHEALKEMTPKEYA